MVWHSTRDPNGNLRYHQEHTDPVAHEQGALPRSQQFADTTPTLGVASRGFAFTGRSTVSDQHDINIHSGKSLLLDPRQSNEYFIEDRSGAQANPSFKGGGFSLQTAQQQIDSTAFTASMATPAAQGGKGPSWWERIKTNFRGGTNTQSTNIATKPPEKFQIGLRSSNVKPAKADQRFPNGPGPVGPSSGSIPQNFVGASGGVIGSVSR